MKRKIVLDTNMFLSAAVFGGMVEKIVDLIFAGELTLYTSSDLSDEIFRKLHEFKATEEIAIHVRKILKASIKVVPDVIVTVCRDADDNFLLELVETAKADYLITRDKDLLELPNSKWKDTKIIKPEKFLPLLRKKKLLN